jgi:hypothetical protein
VDDSVGIRELGYAPCSRVQSETFQSLRRFSVMIESISQQISRLGRAIGRRRELAAQAKRPEDAAIHDITAEQLEDEARFLAERASATERPLFAGSLGGL